MRGVRPAEREEIAGTLWPESSQEQALGNLRRTLTDIRRAFGPAADRLVSPSPRTLSLILDALDFCDLHAAEAGLKAAAPAEVSRALDIASQPFMPGCGLAAIHDYRNALDHRIVSAAVQAADACLGNRQLPAALDLLSRAAARDPLDEAVLRRRMKALTLAGSRASALLLYRDFRIQLLRDLRTEPATETRTLYEQIRGELLHAEPEADAATGSSAAGSTLKLKPLPRPLTPLIGRVNEVTSIQFEVGSGRLVTLLGPGGIGKTRLAVEAAARLKSQFPDGICFADLSGITSADMVPAYLCTCFGCEVKTDADPLEPLCDAIMGRKILLLLDNCEHLIPACASAVTALLDAESELHVLSTSREALGINGERRWLVPALASPRMLPHSDALQPARRSCEDLSEISGFDAVQLFLTRAQAVQPGFTLQALNADSIASICSRLDGIPLAIELAAARLNVLTPQQVESRLSNRFALLTGGSKAAWPRHQTLSALIDWSYELLTPSEQHLFRHLAIFSGGWTLETVTQMVALPNGEDPVDLLSSLIENRSSSK
jgi:predicted ATPase/DNA-binding SARP family transcriptional activator